MRVNALGQPGPQSQAYAKQSGNEYGVLCLALCVSKLLEFMYLVDKT